MPAVSDARRVVVTGHGMITPLGSNSLETFQRASRGESGIDFIRSFDTRGLPCRIAGEVDDTYLDGFDEPGVRRLEKFASRGLKLMMGAAREAARQAQLEKVADRESIGVAIGSHGDKPSVEELKFLHRFYDPLHGWDTTALLGSGGYSPLSFFRRKPDVAMAILASAFACTGPNLSVSSACAAGAQAIGEAYRQIREGRAKVMMAGGCEANVNLVGLLGFVALKALAERYSDPQAASRPFDRTRAGFVLSEGAAVVILEELGHARSRNAEILGEVLGYGDSADAYRITDMDPDATGAFLAMRKALDDAGLRPEDVDYINAHGTSTVQNDTIETLAIKNLLGARASAVPVSSNKSMLGHTISAAGAIEFILTLLGMRHAILLPTINYRSPDPKCDLDYVPNFARPKEQRVALSNSFGFGGQNACLCLGKFADG